MDMKSDSLVDFYTTTVQETHFKCDICAMTFRTPSERNEHILNHFQTTTCSICHQTLVQLGNIWFGPHEHTVHNIIKDELISDDIEMPCDDEILIEHTAKNFPIAATENEFDSITTHSYQPEAVFIPDYVEKKTVNIKIEPNEENVNETPHSDMRKPKFAGICGICNKKFVCSTSLKYHMNIHLGIRPYECDICSKGFADKRNLDKHRRTHWNHSTKYIPMSTENMKKTQNDVEKGELWRCKLCKVVYLSEENLLQHQMSNCAELNNATSKQITNAKQHADNILKCDICSKTFTRAENLKGHMNIHLGVKPYQCKICDKSWARKELLRKHKYTHTQQIDSQLQSKIEVNVELNQATAIDPKDDESSVSLIATNSESTTEKHDETQPSTSTTNSELNESKSAETNVKLSINRFRRVDCGECGKQFSCRDYLKYHMNIHLGLRPFKCNVCERTFADKRNLINHRKIHEVFKLTDSSIENDIEISAILNDEKMIFSPCQLLIGSLCPICDRRFEHNSGLKVHIKHAHKELRFTCKICQNEFLAIDHCRAHISLEHVNTELTIRSYDSVACKENVLIDWVCEYCNKVFELEMILAKHVLKHHPEDKHDHQCNICIEKFSKLKEFLDHMRAHPESNQHKCSFDGCDQTFSYKANLATHLSKHYRNNEPITRQTQDNLSEVAKQCAIVSLGGKCDNSSIIDEALTCSICSKKHKNSTLLRYHIQSKHSNANERIKCTVAECDKIFKTTTGLSGHMKLQHPEAVKECDLCSKYFYSDTKLAEHRLTHDKSEGSFACNICPQKFTHKHRLLAHLNKHEKEATCNICNETFSSTKSMLEHRERHGKKKIIKCRFKDCNQKFEDKRSFTLHAMQHPANERNRLVCTICGKQVSKSGIRGHMNSHTGARPYICKVCGKTFAADAPLRRHNMIHTGEKPYVCDIDGCTQAYRDSIDLKRHKFSVHKIYTKKHICSICSDVFSENKLLTKHIKRVHGSNKPDANI